jgi:4-diphosphocytidyl-2-C-methyl-D-erythritol kinase
MIVRTIAPAKINWTLEVLGKRPDGYHEIKSVMQTIDLCDEVEVAKAERLSLEVTGPHIASEDDYTLRAARLFAERTRTDPFVTICLTKRIPVAAGLGGGSSDAAAVLWAMNELFQTGLSPDDLADLASVIGSDVPFFLRGGTALAGGRGEIIKGVRDVRSAYLVLAVPGETIADKTPTVYSQLASRSYSDGSRTEGFIWAVRQGISPPDGLIYNGLEAAAAIVFPRLARVRDALLAAGASAVHMTGAGPALFCVFSTPEAARSVVVKTRASGVFVFASRTLRSRRMKEHRRSDGFR